MRLGFFFQDRKALESVIVICLKGELFLGVSLNVQTSTQTCNELASCCCSSSYYKAVWILFFLVQSKIIRVEMWKDEDKDVLCCVVQG